MDDMTSCYRHHELNKDNGCTDTSSKMRKKGLNSYPNRVLACLHAVAHWPKYYIKNKNLLIKCMGWRANGVQT